MEPPFVAQIGPRDERRNGTGKNDRPRGAEMAPQGWNLKSTTNFLLRSEAIASCIACGLGMLQQAREASQFVAAARTQRDIAHFTHVPRVGIEETVEDADRPVRLHRQLPLDDTTQRVDRAVAAPSEHASRFEIRKATRYEPSLRRCSRRDGPRALDETAHPAHCLHEAVFQG